MKKKLIIIRQATYLKEEKRVKKIKSCNHDFVAAYANYVIRQTVNHDHLLINKIFILTTP